MGVAGTMQLDLAEIQRASFSSDCAQHMANYRDIYNEVVSTDARYSLAEHSPGLRAVHAGDRSAQYDFGRALWMSDAELALSLPTCRCLRLICCPLAWMSATVPSKKPRLASPNIPGKPAASEGA